MLRVQQFSAWFALFFASNSLAGDEVLSGEELAKANGCMTCHGAEATNKAPSFRMIRRQSEAGLNKFDLTVMSLKPDQEMAKAGKSSVIVARVNDKTHVRIFDAEGVQVADKVDARLTAALPDPGTVMPAADHRKFVAEAAAAAGYESPQSRAKLIQTVKLGGKGQWTHLTKGKPMPPFGGHLTDTEIGRVVDFVLREGIMPSLRTMPAGLGEGTVTITPASPYTAGQTVTLTATPAAGSKFVRWEADATGTALTTSLTISGGHSVRAVFAPTTAIPEIKPAEISPKGLQAYLVANPHVNTPALFLAALPAVYRQNWILMTRSESLQTGTAVSPRILLPSPDGKDVFTIGMTTHSSYPGSHPNAVEYMQWDSTEKNFRFHEIVLDAIPAMGDEIRPDPNNPALRVKPFPARTRGVSVDDNKCSRCHSSQNVLNHGSTPGTDGLTPRTLKVKNKPNWDTYDSWGGMLPFNRDRIYKGSVEAAAFRTLMNPWTWQSNAPVRQVLEQLDLQPPTLPKDHPHFIARQHGGPDDGHVKYKFDDEEFVRFEPVPAPDTALDGTSNYSFDRVKSTAPGTPVRRGTQFITLHHSDIVTSDEGRGVRLFDNLSGTLTNGDLNPTRIGDELADHRGPIDIRPLVLALSRSEPILTINPATQTVDTRAGLPPLVNQYAFFNARQGMMLNALREDTLKRTVTVPRRKGDVQRWNLHRDTDPYLLTPENGLIAQYGPRTLPAPGTDTSIPRLRQEVFRRPPGDQGAPDTSEMNGSLVDREDYTTNTDRVTLYRYFLEPLGVSVDKWSMGVRGRSRTYAFADVFRNYPNAISAVMKASLAAKPFPGLTNVNDDEQLINAVNAALATLPSAAEIPTFTEVQRIFNKGCIECHGGLNYPPYSLFDPSGSLNFSEDEAPPTGSTRLRRSHILAERYTNFSSTPADSRLLRFILKDDEACSPDGVEMMPCGGPKLSTCDIQTLLRWVEGGRPYTLGDPHIRTVGGLDYDFQAAGEFVLLRGETLEIQVRQIGVTSARQLGPNPHTGLTSCVSVNGAVALRVGPHRVTYQPGAQKMELRVNGEVKTIPDDGLSLPQAGRIVRVGNAGGFQIEARGGAVIVITPAFWEHYQLWYLNIDCRRVRGTEGLMGVIPPGSWLPAKADGTSVGARPEALAERHKVLYQDFGNSWRVTDKTTLFDYDTGTSTKSFAVEKWPAFDAEACVAPKVPHGPADKPAQEAIPNAKAVELTQGIVDKTLRDHAIQDIMATGEAGFAKAYQGTNAVRLHRPPGVPVLAATVGQNRLLDAAPRMTWAKARPQPNTTLTYKLYVWPVYDSLDEEKFIRITAEDTNRDPRTITKALVDLKSGQSYYWKIVVDDGKGGTSESVTEKFKVK